MRAARTILFVGLFGVLRPGLVPVRTAEAGGMEFFEQKIRPVLVNNCYACHSAQAKKLRGGLLLDTHAGLLKGGDSGPAVVPGKPSESLLLKALRHEELAMPPKGKLSDAILADFEKWIELGAPDPRNEERLVEKPSKGTREDFWAFQPIRPHAPPPVRDTTWPRTVIDRYLLAALEARRLHPVRDAARPTLLRRLTLDLTGLPPTPAELEAFIHDSRPDAFSRVVDRLLASPAFGERWGRHWLDVARYADSSGKGDNLTYHDAWRYRDYVVAAFNNDKPFDRFIREQIAGDLLPSVTQTQRDEQLTATGFLVVGPKILANRDVEQRKMDVVDDQVDTIGRAFLGLTLGCARCHDHKFDPIPTSDYYALAGILASTRTLDGIKVNNPAVSGWSLRPLGADGEKLFAARRAGEEKLQQVRIALARAQNETDGAERRRHVEEMTQAEKKLLATFPPAPPLVMAVRDEDNPGDIHVNRRGNPHVLGKRVPRGFLRVLSTEPSPSIPEDRSGRLELADWLANSRNSLTARVIVNRVWMHLFGEGLVRSIDNFGVQGELPTHPELLDYLAARFIEHDWSVKWLIRALVLSRAYQIAVAEDADAARIDPDNRLVWRANRRRLEAEVIRDAILVVSGRLDRSLGGSSVEGLGEQAVRNDNSPTGLAPERQTRRSIYLAVIRNNLPPIFEVFDFADPDVSTGRRDATTVPTQALYLMNSTFVFEQAQGAASRLLTLPEIERLPTLYRRALGRDPTTSEVDRACKFLKGYGRQQKRSSNAQKEAWTALCQALFGSTEFRFVE